MIEYLTYLNTSNPLTLCIYISTCLIYFLTPLPVTIIILLNGYLFGKKGFFLSMILVFIGSLILYLSAKFIKNYFNLYLPKIINLEKFNFKKISNSNYSIFFSRYIFPYFFHNIYYGLMKDNTFKFISIIILAEIPMIYALNLLGSSLKEFHYNYQVASYNIFIDSNFYIPLIIILFILILSKLFFKKK